MGLGTITNMAQAVRVSKPPQSTARGPATGRQSEKNPDDDSALAVIRNLYRIENLNSEKTTFNGFSHATFRERIRQFTTSLYEAIAKNKEMFEKIAEGRFSPKALRKFTEVFDGTPGRDFWAGTPIQDSGSKFSNSQRSYSSGRGIEAAPALSWLRDNPEKAMLSQKNIEPERVLRFLR